MKNLIILMILATIPFQISAQVKTPETKILDVDLLEFCKEMEMKSKISSITNCQIPKTEIGKLGDSSESILNFLKVAETDEEKERACKNIREISLTADKPIEMDMVDDKGNPWKFRFHFGFTRTNYRPTDMRLTNSHIGTTTIKGWAFDERTSSSHYNPANWKELQDAFRWLDEPSNTFTISFENKNNAFYVTAFHPKTLKTYYLDKKIDANGNEQTTYTPAAYANSDGTPAMFAALPQGQSAFEIQNTHLLMNYQIGYGRKFILMETPNSGKLVYTARADVGVMVGAARTIHILENGWWYEYKDKMRVQGTNVSLGHKLEYQFKKVALHVEQKYSAGKMSHPVLGPENGSGDGRADYKLDFSTITVGVSVDVFTPNKQKKKKKMAGK